MRKSRAAAVALGIALLLPGLCARAEEQPELEETKKEAREANRKELYDARLKFIELYRLAKKPKPNSGPGRVVGFVVDGDDYSGIAGAVVTAVPAGKDEKDAKPVKAKSGQSGVYEVEGLKPGVYTVEACAEGYKQFERKRVYVRTGIGPGLGRWLMIEMKKPKARKGMLRGEVASICPRYKFISVRVEEAGEEDEDLRDSEVRFPVGADENLLKSVKTLAAGDEVRCSFVRRPGGCTLVKITRIEKKKR